MAENNYAKTPHMTTPNDYSAFEVSDFFDDWVENLDPAGFSSVNSTGYDDMINPHNHSTDSSNHMSSFHEGAMINNRETRGERFVFKTKSQVEVLDDGFKWRKYGKKMVKNSPNPRNYYRCSVEGCPVKKQVERDKEDPQYVLTTYEGVHIHQGPHL